MKIVKITTAFVTPYDQFELRRHVDRLPQAGVSIEGDYTVIDGDFIVRFDVDDNAFRFVARLFLYIRALDNRAVYLDDDDDYIAGEDGGWHGVGDQGG